jgi:type IV pilus assembly protein PilM
MASIGTGVDPGSHSIKVLQGRRKGDGFQLLRASVAPVDRSPEDGRPREALEEALEGTLGELGLKKGPAVVGLSGRDLMIRYTQLPPLPAHRLRVLMDFEVREIADKIEGEVASDYTLLPGTIGDGGEQMAIVAMVKESHLEPRVDACAAGGVPVAHATPNAIALFNAFLKFGEFREGETTLLLDVGEQNTDLAIQRDGDLLFARNLSFGGRTFTEALMSHFGLAFKRAEDLKTAKGSLPVRGEAHFEDGLSEKVARALSGVLGQLVGLVQSSISFCKVQWKQSDLRVDRIVVSGAGSTLEGFDRSLGESIGIPVETFDPSSRLDLDSLPPDEAEQVRENARALVVALGLAQMAVDPRFFRVEVIPSRLRRKREVRDRVAYLAAAGFLAVAYLVFSAVVGSRNLAAAEARNAKVASQESGRSRDEQKYEALLADNGEKSARLGVLSRAVLPGYAVTRTIEAVQRHLEGVDGLWIRAVEVKDVRAREKGGDEEPVVVIEGAGVEIDEDVGTVCDRFAAALKKDLLERYGARAVHSLNRRANTFVIQVDFVPESEATEGEGEGE